VDVHAALLEPLMVGAVALTARAISAEEPELTLVQWRVLVVVHARSAGATVGQIADAVGATSSAVSRLLGRLARRGLVRMEPHPQDGRATQVRVTVRGADVVKRVVTRRLEALREIEIPAADRPALERLVASFAGLDEIGPGSG
jgi:DNA-binding MarR family transcriptional regulator